MVCALLDPGADNNHMNTYLFMDGILSSWLNKELHNKNIGKCYIGGTDSLQGKKLVKIEDHSQQNGSLNWSGFFQTKKDCKPEEYKIIIVERCNSTSNLNI